MIRSTSFSSAALVFFVALFAVAACDSGDPVDSSARCGDVAGRYHFETFEFDPDANEIQTVSVKDTLDAEETEIRLLDNCEFIMTYAFEGGTTQVVDGTFTVTETEVRLRASQSDAAKLQPLYLPRDLSFVRQSSIIQLSRDLTANIEATVDMYELTGRYEGVPPIEGTINIVLDIP